MAASISRCPASVLIFLALVPPSLLAAPARFVPTSVLLPHQPGTKGNARTYTGPKPAPPLADPRDFNNGKFIVDGGYSCQPYCVTLRNGTWVCVMTRIDRTWTEGAPGEHMVSMRTSDHGDTWTDWVTLEPYSNTTTKQVSAFGSIAKRDDDSRLFALWIENVNNVTHLPGNPPSNGFRADTVGAFVWKYSDDQGLTWSKQHYTIPVPKTYIDRINSWKGEVQNMWEVDHVITSNGTLLFAFAKVGKYVVGNPTEVYVMASHNILSAARPEDVQWDMWPRGDHGVQSVDGDGTGLDNTIVEPHILALRLPSPQVYHIVFRTASGYLGRAQSVPGDPTRAWTSSYQEYLVPEGAEDWLSALNASNVWVKNPAGPIQPRMQSSGVILMQYYNTRLSGYDVAHAEYDRNMMWLTAGYEMDGTVKWTQPELALYERDHTRGHGYPDVITTNDGAVYITEAFKSKPYSQARTHRVSPELVKLLLNQTVIRDVATKGLAAEVVRRSGVSGPVSVALPSDAMPDFLTYPNDRYGLTVDLWARAPDANRHAAASQGSSVVLLDAAFSVMGKPPQGMRVLSYPTNGTVQVEMRDAEGRLVSHVTDPACSARMAQPVEHYVAVVVDAGPLMVSFFVDGHLCDGGADESMRWARGYLEFGDTGLGDIGGAENLSIDNSVTSARLYQRVLYTSELMGNWRGGLGLNS